MRNWDGIGIGFWATATVIWTVTYCFLLQSGGFWIGSLIFFLLFLPLSFYLLQPLAIIGGLLGGVVGWIVKAAMKLHRRRYHRYHLS